MSILSVSLYVIFFSQTDVCFHQPGFSRRIILRQSIFCVILNTPWNMMWWFSFFLLLWSTFCNITTVYSQRKDLTEVHDETVKNQWLRFACCEFVTFKRSFRLGHSIPQPFPAHQSRNFFNQDVSPGMPKYHKKNYIFFKKN